MRRRQIGNSPALVRLICGPDDISRSRDFAHSHVGITLARLIENRVSAFYVEKPGGKRFDVIVALDPRANKYLKTTPDRNQSNELLFLSNCLHFMHWASRKLRLPIIVPAGAHVTRPLCILLFLNLPLILARHTEVIGGSRNWDYRYTWLRDAAFSMREPRTGKPTPVMFTVEGSSQIPEII
jgi:hypothetical protein